MPTFLQLTKHIHINVNAYVNLITKISLQAKVVHKINSFQQYEENNNTFWMELLSLKFDFSLFAQIW